jgi:hypothetical protein
MSLIPGWKIMAHKNVVKYVDSAHFAVPQGARAVELVSGGESALMQEGHCAHGTSWRSQSGMWATGARRTRSP